MSADTTILILTTCRSDGKPGMEHRVVFTQNAENMYEDMDYPDHRSRRFNRAWVYEKFEPSPVFYDWDAAVRHANRLEREVGYVEYGIQHENHAHLFFPASARSRRRPAPAPIRSGRWSQRF